MLNKPIIAQPYSNIKNRAKRLRQNMTDAEKLLWSKLRAYQLGVKFRRQTPIGLYIVDFYCHSHRLVIELDGSQHLTPAGIEYDHIRTQWLEAQGLKVIRFNNNDVLKNPNGVVEQVLALL